MRSNIMRTPLQFYKQQISEHQQKIKMISKKLWASGLLRLAVFISTVFCVYFFFGNLKLVIGCIVLGVGLFLFLVSRHSNLKYQKNLAKQLLAINELEVSISERKFHHLPNGAQFIDPSHAYSQDIDLFGTGSLYQYMNRTSLESGAKVLVHSLVGNQIEAIPKKQEAIKELASLPKWRQLFSGSAALVQTEVSSDTVLSWLQSFKPFTPKKTKVLCYGFSLISALL
ncbi:MAG: DNA mismatch repair protein MutS, partial [Bacteroidetes bacterium]|nr:DNA mismatch repair protein MutS [Bacteroidota bacterium]